MNPAQALMLLAVSAVLIAGDAQEQVRMGNEEWKTGHFAAAATRYRRALAAKPRSPEIFFNLGTALYRTGEYGDALAAFERAQREAPARGPLAIACRYNAGNSAFQRALSVAHRDPQGAVRFMYQALSLYRDVLRLDVGHKNAAHNAAVAEQWLELMRKAAESQPQPAPAGASATASASPGDILAQDARRGRSGNIGSGPDANAKRDLPKVEKDW